MSTEREIEGSFGEGAIRIGLVVSHYNRWITEPLFKGAREEFSKRTADRGADDELITAWAPGSFELPVLAGEFASAEGIDGVVVLGCLIRGDTRHDRIIADSIAASLCELSVRSRLPVGLGVITAENADQAEARAGGSHGNKGVEAMSAVLETVGVMRAMRAELNANGEH